MSNVYSNYNETDSYYDDGWMDTGYPANGYADHVCKPVIVDAEGRKKPIVRYTPIHSEGCLVQVERVVEHVTRAPVVSNAMTYWYSNSEPNEKLELLKDNVADKRFSQLGSRYDQSKQVEDFQPAKVATTTTISPSSPSWWARANSTGQDGNQKKLVRIPVGDKPINNEANSRTFQDKNPSFLNNSRDMGVNFYERPDNEGPFRPNRPLSRPTNDIKTAAEFLNEGLRPYQSDNSKPTTKRTGPLSSINWRNAPSTLSPQGPPKSVSWEDDYEKPNEEGQMYGKDNLGEISRGAVRKPNNRELEKTEGNKKPDYNWFGKPTSQPTGFGIPTMQPKEVYSFPAETIDSNEARRGYGKMKPPPPAEEAYGGTMNSNDVIKKYNGVKVPWQNPNEESVYP